MDVIYLMKKEALRRGYSPKTIQTYCHCVGNFLKVCKKEPRNVTKKDVKDYLDILIERGVSGSTINVNLNSLKFLMEEILCKRILLRVRYSKAPKQLPAVLTKEEVVRLIDSISNDKHRLMIKLLYSSGLRVSELVHLKIKDFQFDKGYGWVRKGKGNKDRMFVVAEKLKGELVEYVEKQKLGFDSWLFGGRKGRHTHQRSVQEVVKNAAKKAKITKNVHPPTLRHSFATHLIEDGYDVASVQSLLGHNSAETTMIYIHMASPRMIAIKSPYDNLRKG